MKSKIALLLITSLVILSGADWFLAPEIAKGDDVTVNALVGQTITISTAGSPTSFDTITTAAISTSTPNTTSTLNCNAGGGCQMTVYDSGYGGNPGLASTTDGYLIWSPGNDSSTTASTTLGAGTVEGYGIQATSSSAGMTIAARYDYWTSDDIVGGIPCGSANAVQVASSSAPVTNATVIERHKASIISSTELGSYTDTITYSYTSN